MIMNFTKSNNYLITLLKPCLLQFVFQHPDQIKFNHIFIISQQAKNKHFYKNIAGFKNFSPSKPNDRRTYFI
ncbi:MAG: hypothetical protein CVU11_05285 [Bacteroidetes bacterium HGW-Bacteroidetes-6]|nr:MAG: hypothetical protein CVU11_05285 [Bacteroidetes bacterium HGW-Bacteroidetes-6]